MKRCKVGLILSLIVIWINPGSVYGVVSHVTIDLSAIAGNDFQLEFSLYDNAGAIGDSWALVDNIKYGAVVEDFESGLGGVYDPDSSGSVNVVGGSLPGTGNILRIDEDPFFWPTFALRDYSGSSATELSFDVEFVSSGEEFFGLTDQFVVSIFDKDGYSFAELSELSTGWGDVLEISSAGILISEEVTATVVPVPGALLLCGIGIGMISRKRRGDGI